MSENAEKGTSACATLFGERSNLPLCLASHARILSHACNLGPSPTDYLNWVRAVMSGEWYWRTNCTLSHFLLRLMESQLERETCIFSSLRTAIFQKVQSLQYVQRRHGDKRAIRVPYLRDYCVYFMHSMTPCILWLSDRYCRQLLKVCADRRKNGRLRKYHYSEIQNAGDCVARTGVREIGFNFGSLPHDPGGITCMP